MPRSADDNDALKALGRRVRTLRDERGLTQDQLAQLSGLHRTYISHVERGRNASLLNAFKLAQALGLELADLTRGIRVP